MYPHYHRLAAGRCGRHASRFLWFIFGAGAATFWFKSSEMHSNTHHFRAQWCARHQIPPPAYPAPNSVSAAMQERQQQPEGQANQGVQDQRRRWGEHGHVVAPPLPSPIGGISDEKERLNELGRSISDFSESTLDALLAKIESLKAMLAESRLQREQQEAMLRDLKEARMQEFLDWKREREQSEKEKPVPPRHLV